MWIAILSLSLLALIFGLLLGFSSIRFRVDEDPMVEKINEALPQSQCGKCSYAGCKPYAEAVARGEAAINLCPPGGETTMLKLADLMGVEPMPMDHHEEADSQRKVAVIDEKVCIGCTVCIKACPVDAILGATKQMHTVIASECTGCEKCIEPCPVDCITLEPVLPDLKTWTWPYPHQGKPGPVVALTDDQAA